MNKFELGLLLVELIEKGDFDVVLLFVIIIFEFVDVCFVIDCFFRFLVVSL